MIISDVSNLQELIDFISSNDTIAFDIETTGLDVIDGKIIGFGVSNADVGYYVAHLEYCKDSETLKTLVSFDDCVEILNLLKYKKLITWNGSFDTRFTLNYFNVDLVKSIWSDAMLAKHTVDEEMPFRLKDVAAMLFGDDAKEEQRLMKESIKANGGADKEFYKADLDLMGKYCIADCKLTFAINDHYLSKIKSQGLSDFYFKDEVMPLYTEVVIPMELKGVNIDVELIEKSRKDIIKDLASLEYRIQSSICKIPYYSKFESWYLNKELPSKNSGEFAQAVCKYADLPLSLTKSGKYSLKKAEVEKLEESVYKDFLLFNISLDEDLVESIQRKWWSEKDEEGYMFNLSSKHHLKKLFFEILGESPITKTPTGLPQVNSIFLDKMAEKYDWCELLLQFNKLVKIKGTYIDRLLDKQKNGILYPSWFMHRTVTGRLGGDLMQLPRPLEESEASYVVRKHNNVIRDFIISGADRALVGADYASLEVVVFADDAGEPDLLDMIKQDKDFYSTIAIGVLGLEEQYSADKKSDNYLKKQAPGIRQSAKRYSLGLRYGLGEYALSKSLNISTKEAGKIVESYFSTYPMLKKRMDDLINQATTKGFVKSKGGRVRHLEMFKKLHYTYGDSLSDSLALWAKYHDSPKKYAQMKYLAKQYNNLKNASLNFPIQSMAATITNKSCISLMREFERQGLDAYVCMQIHDEIVVSCNVNIKEKVAKIMKFLMENTTKISAPLNAEPEIGYKYSDIK